MPTLLRNNNKTNVDKHARVGNSIIVSAVKKIATSNLKYIQYFVHLDNKKMITSIHSE